MNQNQQSMESLHTPMIKTVISHHFGKPPIDIQRITIGICNEVYRVGLNDEEIIIRLNQETRFLMGSHDHIPQFKALGIRVPDILFEDYSQTLIPLSYQIQSKLPGQDLGDVITTLTDSQLITLAKSIAIIFNKVSTLPVSTQFGLIWGGGDNDLSDTWTERMKIWLDESKERGRKTGVMDESMSALADRLFATYHTYFDSVKSVMYCGDINTKNVMIQDGALSGLVDLDGLTQGDPLEAIGRIKLSWYGTPHGSLYTQAIMDELKLNATHRHMVTMYALINQMAWACENGIQFNQNTKPTVNAEKAKKDKQTIISLAKSLDLWVR